MEVILENKKGYKKTKLGWIPEDWEVDTIENTLSIENNFRKPISEELRRSMQGEFPYYGPTKIQDYINEYKYEGEYALIAEDGDHFLKYKDFPMTQLVSGRFNVNNHAHALKGTNKCLTKWFYWFYNSRSIFSHLTRQGAGRYKLNKASLSKMKIAYPNLDEQEEIIEILETWENATVNLTKLITKKEQQKTGLMQQLLTGKKRLAGFSGDWQMDKLGEYFSERKERGLDNLELLSIGEAGVYPQANSNKKDTSNKDKSKYKRICVGDIGYNTMRMWQGRSALSSLEGMVSPAYTIVKPIKNADSVFFSYLFKLDEMIHKFYRNSQGMVSDTWMCKYKDFKIVKFNAPPSKEEQTAIANVLQKADLEIILLNKKRDKLKEQKKGLMQQLLTGKKRLKF